MSNKISFMYQLTIGVDENVVSKYLNGNVTLDGVGTGLSEFIEGMLKSLSNKSISDIRVNYLAYDDNKEVKTNVL